VPPLNLPLTNGRASRTLPLYLSRKLHREEWLFSERMTLSPGTLDGSTANTNAERGAALSIAKLNSLGEQAPNMPNNLALDFRMRWRPCLCRLGA